MFGVAAEVEDAVFDVADRVDDLDDPGGPQSFLAGVAGPSQRQRTVVADACDPDGGAGCQLVAEPCLGVDLRAGEGRGSVGGRDEGAVVADADST